MPTSLSQNAYTLLENLLSSAQIDASNTTLEACIAAIKSHFKPPSSAFAEQFKFYSATKTPTESVSDWAVRARELATKYEFGEHLETAIHNIFVMGLEKDLSLVKIFLDASMVTFQRVVEISNVVAYIQEQHVINEVKN